MFMVDKVGFNNKPVRSATDLSFSTLSGAIQGYAGHFYARKQLLL